MLAITIALCKQMQHCWPTTPFACPVACCCMLLGAVVQSLQLVKLLCAKEATTSNIAGPTMLGVVASVCTYRIFSIKRRTLIKRRPHLNAGSKLLIFK